MTAIPALIAGIALVAGWAALRPPEESAVLMFAGDVLLDRGVAETLASVQAGVAVRDIAAVTRQADIAFCNLECPLVANPRRVPKVYSFAATPDKVDVLRAAGFRVVSLANNHAMDCSRPGLAETMTVLRSGGIAFCGAGASRGRARAPVLLLCRGLRVGYLAYSDLLPRGIVGFPGLTSLSYVDDATLDSEIAQARQGVDILVVSFHWGVELSRLPSGRQHRLAARAVGAGADFVIGHHPHVLQPLVAMRKDDGRTALVAYSLGNFIFDGKAPETLETMVLACRADRDGVREVRTHHMRIARDELRGFPGSGAGWVHRHSLGSVDAAGRVLYSPSDVSSRP